MEPNNYLSDKVPEIHVKTLCTYFYIYIFFQINTFFQPFKLLCSFESFRQECGNEIIEIDARSSQMSVTIQNWFLHPATLINPAMPSLLGSPK